MQDIYCTFFDGINKCFYEFFTTADKSFNSCQLILALDRAYFEINRDPIPPPRKKREKTSNVVLSETSISSEEGGDGESSHWYDALNPVTFFSGRSVCFF